MSKITSWLILCAFFLLPCNSAMALVISANDSGITYIGRWSDTTSAGVPVKVALSGGMRVRFKFYGTSLAIQFDDFTAYKSTFEYSIDGGAWSNPRTNAVGTMTLASGLADTEHTFDLYTGGMRGYYRWTNLDGIRIKGIVVDTGKSVAAWPTGLPKMLTLGDSIACGDLVLSDGYTSGRLSVPSQLATLLGYENWTHGAGATGFYGTQPDNGFPATHLSYPWKSSGVPHTDPKFDAVFVEAIQNDGTADRYTQYSSLLQQIHADQPQAKIFCLGLIYPDPQEQASVQRAAADNGCTYISTSGWVFSHPVAINNSHPDVAGAATIAGYLQPIFTSQLTGPPPAARSTATMRASFR